MREACAHARRLCFTSHMHNIVGVLLPHVELFCACISGAFAGAVIAAQTMQEVHVLSHAPSGYVKTTL